jgi:hypothetical protein
LQRTAEIQFYPCIFVDSAETEANSCIKKSEMEKKNVLLIGLKYDDRLNSRPWNLSKSSPYVLVHNSETRKYQHYKHLPVKDE